MTPKAWSLLKVMNWTLSKLRMFSKDTLKRMKRQVVSWENVSTNDILRKLLNPTAKPVSPIFISLKIIEYLLCGGHSSRHLGLNTTDKDLCPCPVHSLIEGTYILRKWQAWFTLGSSLPLRPHQCVLSVQSSEYSQNLSPALYLLRNNLESLPFPPGGA